MKKSLKIIECPRDAMQGWPHFIPTEKKIGYINALLKVGFDTIDFGSFVSPKAIPQMADTKEVLKGLHIDESSSKLLAIVANKRGAEEAVQYDEITYLGFPFSISETFQQRNTNSSILSSFETVKEIQQQCVNKGKQLVVYISMGFGNPYGDPYDESIVFEWANKLAALGINIISLADTVGLSTKEQVFRVTKYVIDSLPGIEVGVHLHSAPHNRYEKIDAALKAGCTRYDAAIKGIGGCPMAGDALVGNMDTEFMLNHFSQAGYSVNIDSSQLQLCNQIASGIFI
ncbi:MAG: hydroxymethylglutaryl-CoA lyase [Bacteroidetes bacterium]|nr:hydroxymethylglutaryl-CoA lyase [Bacteroidota bacterium]